MKVEVLQTTAVTIETKHFDVYNVQYKMNTDCTVQLTVKPLKCTMLNGKCRGLD